MKSPKSQRRSARNRPAVTVRAGGGKAQHRPKLRPPGSPLWKAKQHTLMCGRRVVKHFKSEAPCQEAVLAAFQAAGWEACIAFERDAAGFSKDRLGNAIRNLNRSVRPHLHFGQEANGSRLCWSSR